MEAQSWVRRDVLVQVRCPRAGFLFVGPLMRCFSLVSSIQVKNSASNSKNSTRNCVQELTLKLFLKQADCCPSRDLLGDRWAMLSGTICVDIDVAPFFCQ